MITTPGAFDTPGVSVLERGWLSSNNVLLHDDTGAQGAVLIDSGHLRHAAQTEQLLRQALAGAPLARIVNTHLHSDHCGGNATLQRAFGCRIGIPPGRWQAVQDWDEVALSYAPTGQACERFTADAKVLPGTELQVGSQRWQVHAAPGHDPHSIILFNAAQRVVITADALWERGFGIVFPELDGHPDDASAFDEVAVSLDLIESLGARWAIPGHGAPFSDVPAALAVARQRLAAFRAEPGRHLRHAMKALITFHLLEAGSQSWPALQQWFGGVSLYERIWLRMGRPQGTLVAYAEHAVGELVAQGVLAQRDGLVCSA
jgi:glyoxylase-like metal-dependent hydrolase (beta-lactamase superfamily II)